MADYWERLPHEPATAYTLFTLYRDMGPTRTLRRVAQRQGVHQTTVERASSPYQWVARCVAYDAEQDRIYFEQLRESQRAMADYHATLARSGMQAMSIPIRVLMERMQQPGAEASLTALALPDLINLCRRCAYALESLSRVERQARGLPAEQWELIIQRKAAELERQTGRRAIDLIAEAEAVAAAVE